MSDCAFTGCTQSADYLVTVAYTNLGRPSARPMCGGHAADVELAVTLGDVPFASGCLLELLDDGASRPTA